MNTGLLVLVDKVHQRLLEGPDGVLGSGIERVKVDTAIVVLVGASVDILVFAQVDLGKVVEAISYLFNGILNDLEGRDVLELVCLMQSVDVVSMMDLGNKQGNVSFIPADTFHDATYGAHTSWI